MNKQRKTTRLQDYDYRFGTFAITICTRKRLHFFGEIEDEQMHLNELGGFLQQTWEEIPTRFAHVALDQYVAMPNHFHGILRFSGDQDMKKHPETTFNFFGPAIPGSLSVVINQCKGNVTKWARKNGFPDFGWQGRFFEHIIRNHADLERNRKYIKNNPLNWPEDEFFMAPKSLK